MWHFWPGFLAVGDFRLGRPWLLARGACGGGFGFLEGLWLGPFRSVCFCGPLVCVSFFLRCGEFLGLCWVARKQTIPPQMIFQLPFKSL